MNEGVKDLSITISKDKDHWGKFLRVTLLGKEGSLVDSLTITREDIMWLLEDKNEAY